ncbi:DUF2937 family protein [bacterium]|nr:DUF2937 family protein [bacterium]
MWRLLAIAGGVSGAVVLSQFPEFSQQYLQRLAGKVDALTTVTAAFDASAAKAGLTREAALAQISGSAFNLDHQRDLRATFAEAQTLTANLAALRAASPLARLTMPQRLDDPETLQATWADFKPAIPTTLDGAMTSGIGYVGGWAGVALLWQLLAWPFRRSWAA